MTPFFDGFLTAFALIGAVIGFLAMMARTDGEFGTSLFLGAPIGGIAGLGLGFLLTLMVLGAQAVLR